MSNFQIHELTSGAIDRDSNLMHDTETGGNYASYKTTVGDVADLANGIIAALYDPASSYAIGSYCIYSGVLYRCTTTTTGVFDVSDWTPVLITGEYKRVRVMHKADFDLLTPEEQADGMIFVDDVDITADDIQYSAGVSVADKLDAINAVSQITAITTDSTGIADNDTLVVRYGNLLILNLSFTLSTTYSAQWKDIFSFDDTTLQIQGLAGFLGAVSTESNDNTYGQLYLNTNTNKVTYRVRSGVQNRTYRGQLIVPISNSV